VHSTYREGDRVGPKLNQFFFVASFVAGGGEGGKYFRRIASFPVCSQLDPTCNVDTETSAEIVVASRDGKTLIYTDSPLGALGFVDITDPANPTGLGTVLLGGEPTSVGVTRDFALVVINTSEDFVDVSGVVKVFRISTLQEVASYDLPGQPDSIAISPDGTRAAIAIENERDEDLGDGGIPQLPPGTVVVMDISKNDPTQWTTTEVDITGLKGIKVPEDPEPEYISINKKNIAVVTLQENNGIVLIDTNTGKVKKSFSAGLVDLTQIDATEDGVINQVESLQDVPREPDGVVWLDQRRFATADEGDLDGGSRTFTIFKKNGDVLFSSGNSLDHLAARVGHYNEDRSENKGNEPENIAYASYGSEEKLLFINSERSSLVFVYNVMRPRQPELLQILPAGLAPEGGYPIPNRNLFVAASEDDSREDKFRSVINIYSKGEPLALPQSYPGPRERPQLTSSVLL